MPTHRARRPRRAWPAVAAGVAGMLALSALVACTDPPDPQPEEPSLTATLPPTTAFAVDFLNVTGRSYCDVADEVTPDLQVYTDPSTDLGDPDNARGTYVAALRAFDALNQVAGREVKDDLELLRKTLLDTSQAAAAVDWDLTQVSEDPSKGADATAVAAAVAHVRTYTLQRCRLDIVSAGPTVDTAPPNETPAQRVKRVLEDTYPVLGDAEVACVVPRLPLDFDPTSPTFDPAVVLTAFAECGIDPDNPATPTTVRRTTTTKGG